MKKYVVSYLIKVDDNLFVNTEIVEANDKAEAFIKARDKGERRYSEYKCIISENILHPESEIEDISDVDFMAELSDILDELNF